MTNTVFTQHGERCVFCGKVIDSEAVYLGCLSPQNQLPPMTNGTKPHALSSVTFESKTIQAERMLGADL